MFYRTYFMIAQYVVSLSIILFFYFIVKKILSYIQTSTSCT